MHRTIRRAALVGLTLGLCSVAPALAQPAAAQPAAPQPTQQSFHSLISSGYKVVATAFVAADAETKSPIVVVTLQNNTAVAVCTFGIGSWENLSTTSSADDPKTCDVRAW
jgi:hypothetical protein